MNCRKARSFRSSPIVRGRKGEYRKELLEMRKAGYVRARINGEIVDLGDDIVLDKQKSTTSRSSSIGW